MNKKSYRDYARFHLGGTEGDEVTRDAVEEIASTWSELLAQKNLEGAAFSLLRRHVQGALQRDERVPAFTIEKLRQQPGHGNLPEDLLAEFYAALTDLPERQRDVIVLHQVLGYSSAQTARYLGLSQTTVRSHLAIGMRRLTSQLTTPPRAVQRTEQHAR
ncbi:sigma-70 family RNA polymerase sigma factor [Streptomyces sp. E1N211]|uniref:RNA polymerase sigma factor n=1 Tax=Streptomyces sp. E1N211 TaxID=1851876 RepID=UPI0018C2341A|nr:sigma-70 family RNA polymerase sigma factor [Streptomyces sp. E1N211]